MAYTYTDTYASKKTTLSVPTLDFSGNFALKSNTGKEAVLVNTTTALDSPETIRFAINNIANVYSGETDIDPSLYGAVKKGKSFVASVKDSLEITNPDGQKVVYPITAHFVVKFPIAGSITAKDIQDVFYRMIACANNGAEQLASGGVYTPLVDANGASIRFNEELRGALAPEDTVVKDYGA